MSLLSADAVLQLKGAAGAVPAGAVLELDSPMSRASVGSDAARFLVGCTSRMGLLASDVACSIKSLTTLTQQGLGVSFWKMTPPPLC